MDKLRTIVLGVANGALENTPDTKAAIYDAVQAELVTGREMGHKNYPIPTLALTPQGKAFAALAADDAAWERVRAHMGAHATLADWTRALQDAQAGDTWRVTWGLDVFSLSAEAERGMPILRTPDVNVFRMTFASEKEASFCKAEIQRFLGDVLMRLATNVPDALRELLKDDNAR